MPLAVGEGEELLNQKIVDKKFWNQKTKADGLTLERNLAEFISDAAIN